MVLRWRRSIGVSMMFLNKPCFANTAKSTYRRTVLSAPSVAQKKIELDRNRVWLWMIVVSVLGLMFLTFVVY